MITLQFILSLSQSVSDASSRLWEQRYVLTWTYVVDGITATSMKLIK